jgi:hypothetical protein
MAAMTWVAICAGVCATIQIALAVNSFIQPRPWRTRIFLTVAASAVGGAFWWTLTENIWLAINVMNVVFIALVLLGLLIRRRMEGIDL